jgi:hypothetical protein
VEAVDVVEDDRERDDDEEEDGEVLDVRGDDLRRSPWRPGAIPRLPSIEDVIAA